MSTVRQRWAARLATRRALERAARKRYIWHPTRANARTLMQRREQIREAEAVLRRHPKPAPLSERAYHEAERCIGIVEVGGNNAGARVSAIIRENGGTGPEPWCGDFMAHCYRVAGSVAVTRAWAAVRLLGGLAGLKVVKTPRRGDLVRFKFDHVGMYVRHVSPGVIETIEGNTGSTGAVSDSRTGGDGVYRKHRSTSLVQDYVRVSR